MKKIKIFMVIILILIIVCGICFCIPHTRALIVLWWDSRNEFVRLGEVDKIQVYYYPDRSNVEKHSDGIYIEITDKEIIDFIKNEIPNKIYTNYSSQLGIILQDSYVVNIGDDICLKFPDEKSDYMYLVKNNHSIMIKSIPKVMKKIVDIVDEELTRIQTMI